MKPRIILPFGLSLVVATITTGSLQAATFQWDANAGSAGAQDGGGTWDATTTNWINATNVAWVNANDAVFGAGTDGAYAVDVAFSPVANKLVFNHSAYTLSASSSQTITAGSATTTNQDAIFVADGKSATIGANLTVTTPTAGRNFWINGTGTLTIGNGGVLKGSGTANSNILYVNGTTVNVSAGGLLTTTYLSPSLGGTALFVNGTVNVNGGTVDSKLGTLGLGQTTGSPSGTLTLTSGEVLANSTNGVRIGSNSGTTPGGTVNLDGGTLSTLKIHKGTGTVTTSVVNFNGGTLKKGVTSNDVFLGGVARANVRDGGAIIDTNGFSATITQALEHSNIGGDAATDGGLTKNGGGLLTLSGANTYNGGTTINGGVLQFESGSAPASGSITINSGGALNLAGAFTTASAALAKISTGSTGVMALTGNLTEDINFGSHGSLVLGATADAVHTGTITASGNTYRLGGGGASLTLATANALSGANNLVVGSTGATGTVVLAASNNLSGSITVQSGALEIRDAINSASGITNNSALSFNPATGVTITPAAISGAGTLSKIGAGTLVLNNASTYQGNTSITGGILRAAHPNAFGSSSVTVNGSNQQLQLDGGITIANAVRANGGGLSNTDGAVKSLSGINTLSDFGFAGTNGTRVHAVLGSTLIFSNAFASGNASNFRLLGAGTVVLSGNNSGALGASNTVLLGDGANAGPVVKAGNDLAFGNAAIDFQANSSATLQSDSATARTFANNVVFRGAAATLGTSSTGDLSFNGTVTLAAGLDLSIQNSNTTFNGAIAETAGGLGLTKSGAGTLTLAGTGGYTGATTVTGGKLVVNGNISTSSGVLLNGGILAGSGTVGGITLNVGAIAPGNSLGTLTADDLAWNGGLMNFELSSVEAASDLLDLAGVFSRGTGTVHAFDFLGTGAGGFTYNLVNFASTDFTVEDFSYTNLAPGLTGSFVLNSDSLTFTVAPVPEPSSLITGALLGTGLVLRRRRRTER